MTMRIKFFDNNELVYTVFVSDHAKCKHYCPVFITKPKQQK